MVYVPDDKALGCDIAVGDVDVGVALGAFAAADAGTIITRSLDFAAADLDVRGVGRIAAAADGCTERLEAVTLLSVIRIMVLRAFGVPVGGL